MRCLLLAFSLGIVMLQQQASLPALWHAVYALPPVLGAIGCAVYSSRAVGARRGISRVAALLIAAFSVGMAGFFYAAWRADTRLADALPSAWEGGRTSNWSVSSTTCRSRRIAAPVSRLRWKRY